MSSPELDGGVTSCIADIISAFHDGSEIIEQTKIKRASERAPPPSRLLEESVDQAPEEIRREMDMGVHLGAAFKHGDLLAICSLQKITIELQKSLLDKLKDRDTVDFTALVDAADLGREKTLAALRDLRQRIESQNDENADNASHSPTSSNTPRSQSSFERDSHTNLKTWKSNPDNHTRRVSRDLTSDKTDTTAGAEELSQPPGRKRSSILGFLTRHRRGTSGSGDHLPRPGDDEFRRGYSISVAHRPSKTPQPIAASFAELHDSPSDIWARQPCAEHRRESAAVSPDETSTKARSASLSFGQLPVVNEKTGTSTPAIPSTEPTPDNHYLGFCKNAFRLQTGDRKAMQKSREFNDGWSQSVVHYLSCGHNKCAFAGHISVDVIWDKVWTVGTLGIKFRWAFLAKSHIPQPKVKDRFFLYQCIFCVFSGIKSPTFHGTDDYMNHVHQHRNDGFGEVLLYKTKCIAGRVAKDTEDFDINLCPGEIQQLSLGSREDFSGDTTPRKNSIGAQDSVVDDGERPWNEGLSEFHWKEDFI